MIRQSPRRLLSFPSLLATLLLVTCGLSAQEEGSVRYRFTQGEEVRYRVVAVDSILLHDRQDKRLSRRRVEVVKYRCDSILPDGNYLVTVEWTDYAATERYDTLPEVIRTTHPWIGHPRSFIMTPTGHRVDMVRYDKVAGAAPGGPFAPLAIPCLGEGIEARGNDIFPNKQWLFDNVFPPVMWNGTTYRNLQGVIDTLGEELELVELTETARAYYIPTGMPDSILTESRINGAGRYLLSSKKGYPVGGTYDLIADITLNNSHGETVEGRHVMSTIIELYNDQPALDESAPAPRPTPSTPRHRNPHRR